MRAAIALGRGLGMRVVVEGVETAAQLGALRDLGGDLVQGYLFGRPMPAEAAAALLEARRPAPAAG
jgi:EAL domain-containing protein (putative c-di-GMP-specific phosphodiesterase class I)